MWLQPFHTHQRRSGGELESESDTSSYLGHCVSLHVSGERTEIQRDIIVCCSTQCGREQKWCKHEAAEYKDQPGQSSWCARGLVFMALKAAQCSSISLDVNACRAGGFFPHQRLEKRHSSIRIRQNDVSAETGFDIAADHNTHTHTAAIWYKMWAFAGS